MIVVSDTSPVRGLIAIGKPVLLQQLFSEIFIPPAVEAELLRIQFLKNEIPAFLELPWVHVKSIQHNKAYDSIRESLDEGESEAIVLAHELGAHLLLMDENKGREIAKQQGLKALGLVGVLLKAKKANYIVAVKPDLDALINTHGFWIGEGLYKNVLAAAGE